MKGIVLAGGTGSRLFPVTIATSKQLLPIFDKPMIYYPLSVLLMAGIRDILIITSPRDRRRFEELLRDGAHLGVRISFAEQAEPRGLADAFIIGKSFLGSDDVVMILGDNIFYGSGLTSTLRMAINENQGATIFGQRVDNPSDYGVVEFSKENRVVRILEKPSVPPSSIAVTGLYIFDNAVVGIAESLKPSSRGELEIADVINVYLGSDHLQLNTFSRGFAWFDTGTPDSYVEANVFVQAVEKRQGLKIACLEEIAFYNKWISREDVIKASSRMGKTEYSRYLNRLVIEAS